MEEWLWSLTCVVILLCWETFLYKPACPNVWKMNWKRKDRIHQKRVVKLVDKNKIIASRVCWKLPEKENKVASSQGRIGNNLRKKRSYTSRACSKLLEKKIVASRACWKPIQKDKTEAKGACLRKRRASHQEAPSPPQLFRPEGLRSILSHLKPLRGHDEQTRWIDAGIQDGNEAW